MPDIFVILSCLAMPSENKLPRKLSDSSRKSITASLFLLAQKN
jgi:hypothetical protein